MRILFTSIRRFTIFCVYTTVIVLVLVYMCQFSSQYLCIAYVSAYQFYSFCVRIYSYIWIYIYVSILFNDSFVSSLVIQCFPVFVRQRQSESDSSGQHFLFIKTFDYTQLEGKKRPPPNYNNGQRLWGKGNGRKWDGRVRERKKEIGWIKRWQIKACTNFTENCWKFLLLRSS